MGVHIEILEATDTHVVRTRLRKLTPAELEREEQPLERNA
jgi:hypothetical protein